MTICIDFDGVLHFYKRPFTPQLGPPIQGAAEATQELYRQGHTLIIFTTRGEAEIIAWLSANGFKWHFINFNPEDTQLQYPTGNPGKPRADVYIDDRALKFDGNWVQTLQQLKTFRPWNL